MTNNPTKRIINSLSGSELFLLLTKNNKSNELEIMENEIKKRKCIYFIRSKDKKMKNLSDWANCSEEIKKKYPSFKKILKKTSIIH